MIDINLESVRRQFSEATWEAGRIDARAAAVLSCAEVPDMRGWYTAKVTGDSRRPAEVEFQIGRTVVHGTCDCEARYDCRHLVAALLTLADDALASDVHERKALSDWLDLLEDPPDPPTRRIVPRPAAVEVVPSKRREVRYVLGTAEHEDGTLRVTLEARVGPKDPPARIDVTPPPSPAEPAAPAVDGEPASDGESDTDEPKKVAVVDGLPTARTATGKSRVIRLVATNAQAVIPAGVVSEDLDLWHAWRSFAQGETQHVPPREGAADLLLRFAETGRARWGHWGGPRLRVGERVRKAALAWVPTTDAKQRLSVTDLEETEEDDTLLLPLDRPLWLNAQSGDCGNARLDGREAGSDCRALFGAPLVRIEGGIDDDLSERIERQALPLPLSGDVRRIEAPLRSSLSFQSDDRGPRALVTFSYEGLKTAPSRGGSAVSGWQDGVLTVIDRDADAEGRAMADLRALSLPDPLPSGVLPLTADDWIQLLDVLPVFEARGWVVRGTPPASVTPLEASAWYLDIDETPGDGDAHGWFSFELGVDIDGPEGTRRVNLLPVLLRAIEEGRLQHDRIVIGAAVTLRLDDGTLLRIDAGRVQRLLDGLVSLSTKSNAPNGRGRVSTYDAAWLSQLEVDRWKGGPQLRALGEALTKGVTPEDAELPADFQGELRDYQRTGLAWMQLLQRTGCGGVLADDMGLGKTVQVLAHILGERNAGRLDRPALVVAPVSVLGTWAQQAGMFTPELRVGLAHGPDRIATVAKLDEYDLVLTSYATLLRDQSLQETSYHMVALDEAQAIKNPRAKISGATRGLRCRQRLALTGTPVENNLTELWSIFRFVAPGLLGTQAQFSRAYARPVERNNDAAAQAGLQRRAAPFLLRRTKDAVLQELPPKTEVVRTVVLSEEEREIYETVRRAVSDDVREALRRKGLALSRIVVLEALLRLRQICCDARLAPVAQAQSRTSSAKLDELMALLEPLVASGHRVLVFSQFTKMLDLVAPRLEALALPFLMLTGKTRKRQNLVDRFQAGEVPLMLISLKAGGTGLNLTAADTVVLFDPWWNPAVEQQAIDRTHRIGQERPVTVYRLVCEGSVEERILALQDHKRRLAAAVHDRGDAPQRSFQLREEDVEALLAPLDASAGPRNAPMEE